jgi:hypothetical protein
MVPQPRRLDQIIARRRLAKPKDRARHLKTLRYQLDGINDLLPTTEIPYKRTPFIYETYPTFWDIPALENEIYAETRKVKFGTITEYPIDNLPPLHPSGTRFSPTDYRDWNTHAPTILDFIEFANLPWDDTTKRAVIAEYWQKRHQATLTTAELEAQLALHQQAVEPPVEEEEEREDTTTIGNVSDEENHPTDEYTSNESDADSSTHTPPKRRRYFDQYTEGPCVSCTPSPHFPGIELNAATFGRTHFTHLDTSGNQFTILPGVDYHFNDVTISLTENRTGLEILAICPEVVDVTNVPDTTETSTDPTDSTPTSHKRKTYTTSTARTYNLRPKAYTRSPHTCVTGNNSTSTSSSASYTSDDTPPPTYYDPNYNPSDYDTEEEELLIDTSDSGTNTSSLSDNELTDEDDTSTEPPVASIHRTTYGLESTNEIWHTHVQESVRALSLRAQVPETVDLTQSDGEQDTSDEAGDIIVLTQII